MGEVYRARDARLGRDVAVKVLPEHMSADPKSLARFEREARAVASLSHPHLLAIHDVGNADGTVYAVMELLEGSTLRERINSADIGSARAVEWALQIAQGLAAAHERGIVHRDLKPENVFVTRENHVKILDFGLAQHAETDPARADGRAAPITETGVVVGTIGYLSPEQARGHPADHRSDIFAFGTLLYELVTGARAFEAPTAVETMAAVVRDEPTPISHHGRRVPREVEEIVRHCLEKEPTQRFRSARDLVFALRLAEQRLAEFAAPQETELRAPAPRQSPEPSIAVMPFRTVGSSAEGEYFSEGMTEDVIAALSSVPGLRVAARTSVFALRGKDDDVRRIGRELGVATVLDGSVRQAGQRLRVTAQLIDVASGYNLWSERWDRDVADVFAVQDEIARAIAATFQSRSSPGAIAAVASSANERPRLVAPATRDVAAYDHYLKGRYFFNRRRSHEAIAELEAAVSRDPEFDEAYTVLSEAWAAWGFYGGVSTWECWARGRAAADRAEEISPDAPSVAICLGVLEHYYGWNSAREAQFFRLAIARSPASAEAHFWLALCFSFLNRTDEALALAREGVRLEPHSANNRAAVGWPLIAAGRDVEAAADLGAAVALGDSPFALWSYGTVLSVLGRPAEAITAHRSAVKLTGPHYSYYTALLANALAQGGQPDEARAILRDLDERFAGRYLPPFDRAVVLTGLGEVDAALDALEQAYRDRNAFLWGRIQLPQLRPLAETPRFKALAAQLARRASAAL
jgi:TolB-like protein